MNLHVVEIHYRDAYSAEERIVETEALRQAGVYEAVSDSVTFDTPALPPEEQTDDRIQNLGLLGGKIADAVARGLTAGRQVVVTGGNCSHLPGVIGGLQQALGPETRIGLVWFDAHGDFNTPRTTLSGMLGGMPVAVSAGLCYAPWRTLSHQQVPLPTDRIIMVDVRNLDEPEEQLIRATDVTIARDIDTLATAVKRLAAETDVIYLHIDLDVLDVALTPTHPTKEPNGLDLAQTLERVDLVLQTGKVRAFGLLAIFADGPEGRVTMDSAEQLMRGALERWHAVRDA